MAEGADETRENYKHFLAIPTRWHDNDIYGHVNNVVFYAYFDTVVAEYYIASGGFNIHGGSVIGLVVETLCRYHQPIAFPDIDRCRSAGRAGSARRACATRSACSAPATRHRRRPAISSMSSSTA